MNAEPGTPMKASGSEQSPSCTKEPNELGYDYAIWTADRLRAHLKKKTRIDLSDSRFRALIKRATMYFEEVAGAIRKMVGV